jgi:hypothetical protein
MSFTFPGAYGGTVTSEHPPQIHGKICELRRMLTLGAEKRPGVMFPVKDAKQLNQKLAEALDQLEMVASPIAQDVSFIDTGNIPKNENKSGNPVFRTLVHVKTTVRLIAPDTSFHDVTGSGHGGDTDDKAGGKASTFSWKDAILKGITVPSEDMPDTDDEQQSARGQVQVTKQTRSLAVMDSEPAEETGLEAILEMIAKAKTVADLEAVRNLIKGGAIHGNDRIKAAKPFADKMAELTKEQN